MKKRALVGMRRYGIMTLQMVDNSVVVRGQQHNPTILNPDFLKGTKIVESDWGWTPRRVLTTEMLSVVEYDSGLAIQVTPETLQVRSVQGTAEMDAKMVALVGGYVSVLEHVRYTALGVNFQSIAYQSKPHEFIRDRYLAAGDWRAEMLGADIRLTYPLPEGKLVISLNAGEREEEKKTREIVLINANFHRELTDHPAAEQIKSFLAGIKTDRERFKETAVQLLEKK